MAVRHFLKRHGQQYKRLCYGKKGLAVYQSAFAMLDDVYRALAYKRLLPASEYRVLNQQRGL